MSTDLKRSDVVAALESLKYEEDAVLHYQEYPGTYQEQNEMRKARLEEIQDRKVRLRSVRDSLQR